MNSDFMEIANVVMTGSDVEVSIPDGMTAFALQPRTGTAYLRLSDGATPYWTMLVNTFHTFQTRTLQEQKIYLRGTVSEVVEMITLKG